MRIDKLQADLVRNDTKSSEAKGVSEAEAVKQASAPVEAPRVDKVQISDAGRALAEAHAADGESLSVERLHVLRELVVGGKYDNPEVIAEVARRMSASGDLVAIGE